MFNAEKEVFTYLFTVSYVPAAHPPSPVSAASPITPSRKAVQGTALRRRNPERTDNPKSVIRPTFQSISLLSGLFMPYQHFFMFHDVTWARHSKQASSALALGNVRHLVRIPVSP